MLHLKSRMSKVSAYSKNYFSDTCSCRQNSAVAGAIARSLNPFDWVMCIWMILTHSVVSWADAVLKRNSRSFPLKVILKSAMSLGSWVTKHWYKSKLSVPRISTTPFFSFEYLKMPSSRVTLRSCQPAKKDGLFFYTMPDFLGGLICLEMYDPISLCEVIRLLCPLICDSLVIRLVRLTSPSLTASPSKVSSSSLAALAEEMLTATGLA